MKQVVKFKTIEKAKAAKNAMQKFVSGLEFGYLKETDMPQLIKLDRLCPVLVRIGGGRFTCAAQDVAHMIELVEKGGDYVRDVCLPVGTKERASSWVQEPSIPKCVYNAAATKQAGLLGQVSNQSKATGPREYLWDESQCGGVFDGHGVVSDADSGL